MQQKTTKTEQTSDAELTIVAANVQMVLIAPDGKETGYDPKLKKQVRTIPDSTYYEDALLAFDSGRVDPNTTQTLSVQHPKAGKYRLVVSSGTARDGQEYEVRIAFAQRDGSETHNLRLAGAAKREKPAIYELRVSEDPPGVLIADPARR